MLAPSLRPICKIAPEILLVNNCVLLDYGKPFKFTPEYYSISHGTIFHSSIISSELNAKCSLLVSRMINTLLVYCQKFLSVHLIDKIDVNFCCCFGAHFFCITILYQSMYGNAL